MNEVDSTLGESQRRTGVWVAVGLLLLVFGFTIALTLPAYVDRSNPFWVVGMLVIFGAALSLVAVVFRWLGLASRDEAFGLPSGSVRTLLAVGVMVLFAVFGLQAVSSNPTGLQSQLGAQDMGTAVAPAASAALQAEIKRLQEQSMAVVVEAINGERATLRLYRIDRARPPATVDMEKQLLTALITLLTSVVSFYFGSRSAEAARELGRDKADGGAQLTAVESDVRALDETVADQLRRHAALQSEATAPESAAALATALAALAAEAPAITEARKKLDPLLVEARAGGAQTNALIEALKALQEKVSTFGTRLREAEALVAKG